MMSPFEVRPTNESIRKGLKQHPIRGSHNDCQCCKLSKCSLADVARSGHVQCNSACPLCANSGLMHCNKVHRYSSVSSALSVSVSDRTDARQSKIYIFFVSRCG